MATPRQPPGRFLGPSGLRSRPLRRYPQVKDEQYILDRIKEARDPADEPECIGPAILDSYAESNAFRFTQEHQAAVLAAQQLRPLLAAEDRILDIRRRAKHARVDLTHEVDIMNKDLKRAREGNRKPPKRVEDRLVGLEALLDGIAA